MSVLACFYNFLPVIILVLWWLLYIRKTKAKCEALLTPLIFMCQTGAIDDLHRTVQSLDGEDDQIQAKISEGKGILSDLAALKYELQHNRQLTYAIASYFLLFYHFI